MNHSYEEWPTHLDTDKKRREAAEQHTTHTTDDTTADAHTPTTEPPKTPLMLAGVHVDEPEPRLKLWHALELGLHDEVLKLLRAGENAPSIDEKGGPYGSTPLGWAAFTANLPLARELIALNAQLDAPATRGSTPLHMATWNADSHELVQLLLDAKADPAAKNSLGESPLDHAIALHQLETAPSVEDAVALEEWRQRWSRGEAGRSGVIEILSKLAPHGDVQ